MKVMLSFIHVYRKLGMEAEAAKVEKITNHLPKELSETKVQMEYCFNVEYNKELMQAGDLEKMRWLITETFEPEFISTDCPFLDVRNDLYVLLGWC